MPIKFTHLFVSIKNLKDLYIVNQDLQVVKRIEWQPKNENLEMSTVKLQSYKHEISGEFPKLSFTWPFLIRLSTFVKSIGAHTHTKFR